MKPVEYIKDLFDEDDKIALVLISRSEDGKTQQRIWTAAKAASDPVQRWLRHSNAHGSDIYVSMNPLHPEARRRRKDDVAEVRRVYLDLDKDGSKKLARVLKDGFDRKLPMPSYIVNSSKQRYQVIWNVKPGSLSKDDAETLMRGLAREYGGDRAATDVSRVLRLPDFKHRSRGDWISMSATGQQPASREQWPGRLFQERTPEALEIDRLREAGIHCTHNAKGGWDCTEISGNEYLGNFESPSQAARELIGKSVAAECPVEVRSGGGDRSPSGRDWGQTKDRLREGESPAAIESEIEARRQDKHNPADYARRTVTKARESLALER